MEDQVFLGYDFLQFFYQLDLLFSVLHVKHQVLEQLVIVEKSLSVALHNMLI